MEELKKSSVVFDEERHTYYRGDVQLSGVTNLIHSVLRLGIYPDAPEKVKQVFIPRAGYHGTCVHQAIRTYEELGIEQVYFPEKEHETKDFGTVVFPAQDVSPELKEYKRLKGDDYKVLASEFTVDYLAFASQIDAVWTDDNGNIILVDFKTNNLDKYPGGEEALKEYLSWQLSCYAFMFEKQTGNTVNALYGMWLKGNQGGWWHIPIQPADKVEKLLNTVVLHDADTGEWTYLNEEMQVSEESKPEACNTTTDLAVPQDLTKAIADYLRMEKEIKVMKERLRELMEQNGITKWECDEFTATIGKPSERITFDEARFKDNHRDMWEQYHNKVTKTKGSFTIKAK